MDRGANTTRDLELKSVPLNWMSLSAVATAVSARMALRSVTSNTAMALPGIIIMSSFTWSLMPE